MLIRSATSGDVDAMLDIYGPIVEQTATSFELERPSVRDFSGRVAAVQAGGDPWLVALVDGELAGYAYASPFRSRPAYTGTRETTIYVRPDQRGSGVGRTLMREVLSELERQDLHRAVAGIVLPNDSSIALHERLGFRLVGVFTEVGYKFGRWHDLGFWERSLNQPQSG